MNRHCKALVNLGATLIALVIATVIVAGPVGVFIWFLGEGIAITVLAVLCVVGLYIKLYKNET